MSIGTLTFVYLGPYIFNESCHSYLIMFSTCIFSIMSSSITKSLKQYLFMLVQEVFGEEICQLSNLEITGHLYTPQALILIPLSRFKKFKLVSFGQSHLCLHALGFQIN